MVKLRGRRPRFESLNSVRKGWNGKSETLQFNNSMTKASEVHKKRVIKFWVYLSESEDGGITMS